MFKQQDGTRSGSTKQDMMRSASPKQEIARSASPKQDKQRIFEVAGGVTAECAALCCCPCAVFGLVSMAIVKVPAGFCRKAFQKVNKKLTRRDKTKERKISAGNDEDTSFGSIKSPLKDSENVASLSARKTSLSTEEFWEEVTGKSYVGFWRNLSFKDD